MISTNWKWSSNKLSRVNRCLVVVWALGLAACSNTEFKDLEGFVEETRAAQKGRIEPLPQFKPFETFSYASTQLRAPFAPWVDESADVARQNRSTGGPQPNFDRRKELLEKFPLDALRMVGTLAREDGHWAIVQAPDGMVYRVKEGNYLGQNHGKITQLGEQKLQVLELVPDGLGGWLERQASLVLQE